MKELIDTQTAIKRLSIHLPLHKRITNILLPVVLIALSLTPLFHMLMHPSEMDSTSLSKKQLIILSCVIFLFAVYALYNNMQFTRLRPVYSKLGLAGKAEVIKAIVPQLKTSVPVSGGMQQRGPGVVEISYCKSLLHPILTILVLTDENGFYVNVMDMFKLNPIDFGIYQRVSKKVVRLIEEELAKR